jgi:hypothetical protein
MQTYHTNFVGQVHFFSSSINLRHIMLVLQYNIGGRTPYAVISHSFFAITCPGDNAVVVFVRMFQGLE